MSAPRLMLGEIYEYVLENNPYTNEHSRTLTHGAIAYDTLSALIPVLWRMGGQQQARVTLGLYIALLRPLSDEET